MPKTNAEYCRDYRRRKRENRFNKVPKSSTERVREFRARRKALNVENASSNTLNDDFTVQNSERDHSMPKTNAEYCRDYRKKKRENKIKKVAKSSTERVREFRARKKNISFISSTVQNSENNHYVSQVDVLNVQDDASTGYNIVNNDSILLLENESLNELTADSSNRRTYRTIDSSERLIPRCGNSSTAAQEVLWNLQMTVPAVKQEEIEITYEGGSQYSDSMASMYPSDPIQSSEYVNYYDSKDSVFKQVKKEFPDEEYPQSSDSMNNKEVIEGLLKVIDIEKVKTENQRDGSFLKVKEENEDEQQQFAVKTERLEEQGILDNDGDTNTPYDVYLTPREVQSNLYGRSLINGASLLKPNNEHVKVGKDTSLVNNGMYDLHQCQYCSKYFINHDDLFAHDCKIHNTQTHKCNLCEERFNSEPELECHVSLSHKSRYPPSHVTRNSVKCKYCNAYFESRYKLSKHVKLCHIDKLEKKYKCDSCEGRFISKHSLTRHIKKTHYNSGKMFDCWCGKQFPSSIHLSDHKTLQHDRRFENKNVKYNCKNCDAVLNSKFSLTNHMKRIHYDYGKMFDCSCGKQFRSPIHLREHKRLRHDRKFKNTNMGKYQCDSCQKYFKTKQYLVVHIKRIHYDYREKFKCWCGKEFRTPIQLNVHKKTTHVLMYGGFKFSF